MLQAIYAQETDVYPIALLTVDHPDLTSPIRVCSDSVAVVSRGNTFVPFPFELMLLTDDPEEMPSGQLEVDAVDQRMTDGVLGLTSAPTLLIEQVLNTDLNTLEMSTGALNFRDVDIDVLTMLGRFLLDDILNEPSPSGNIDPRNHPGVFAALA